jgi:hypothetical protein
MCAFYLNVAGLICDAIGATLLWKFGLPPNVRRGGTITFVSERTDPEEAKKAARYDRLGNFGMFLLVLGFFLQGVSAFAAQKPSC